MDKKNYEYAKNNLSYSADNYEVWNIPDIDDFGFIVKRETLEKEQEKIKITEETYQIIRRKIDEFISTHTIVP